MKKILIYALGIIVAIGVIGGIVNVFTGNYEPIDNNSATTDTTQSTGQSEETQSDKPENYIDNLNIPGTIQKGRNQRMLLIGHFEREDMPAEEKIAFAQETEGRIQPEIQTLMYNMQNDSKDGGDYDYTNLYVGNAYGSIYNMCEDTIKYYQTGDETYKTEFYEQSERALENLQKADQAIKEQ